MDVTAAKAKTIVDISASSKPKSTAEQLMGDFSAAVAARMKKSGQGVAERGQANIASALDTKRPVKTEPRTEAKTEAAPRDDHHPRERAEAPERPRDDVAHPAEAKNDTPREAPQQDAPRANTAQDDHGDTQSGQEQSTPDSDQGQDDGAPNPQAQSNDDGDSDGVSDVPTQQPTEQANDGQGEQALAAVVDMVSKSNTPQNADGKSNAMNGLEKAQAAVTGQQTAGTGAEANSNTDDAELAGDGAQKKTAANTGQQQAQTSLAQKGDANHASNQDAALKQQQAADIASKVGPNQKLDVNVTVTKQSEQLVSQPTANLGVQAAISDDGDGLNQAATQTAAKSATPRLQVATPHNLGNQTGQQGSDAQQQAQQQMQLAQAEVAKAVTTTDAKSQAGPAANASATNATFKVGGAEGMSTTAQGVTQTNTAQPHQQAAAMPKHAADPHAQARAQVTDQVNVQISKAIANGMDKISIQLRPAHLGRVDVQLEMASDGRVTAVVMADNKDTLDLLKQDSRELERAMREAGLQMNSGDLSFNLRENGDQAHGGEQSAGRGLDSGPLTNEPSLDELLEAGASRPNIITEDRVDITA